MDTIGGALRIAALNRAAHEAGLHQGLSLADARARIGDVAAAWHDKNGDAQLMLKLAHWFERFTPLVALDPPLGAMLDITGCEHLFGDAASLRATLTRSVAGFGFSVKSAFARTPDLARALARHASSFETEDEYCAHNLPIVALEAGEETHLALLRAGLKSIGDMAARPSQVLTARFGGAVTEKLARLIGVEDRRITPLRPLPECRVERHFPEPFAHQTGFETVVEPLISEAAHILEKRGQGGRVFDLLFFRTDGVVRSMRIETATPLREPKIFMRLFRLKFDKLADPLDPGFGFDAIRLCVMVVQGLTLSEPTFDGAARGEADLVALQDRLVAQLGRERVLRGAAADTHDPTRASFLAPIGSVPGNDVWSLSSTGPSPERPLRVFDPPQPIKATALAPDGPPAQFLWRRVRYVIKRAEGPERIAPEWWRTGANAPTLDYYRVEDADGRRFWVFRAGLYDATQPRWFLHGLFA